MATAPTPEQAFEGAYRSWRFRHSLWLLAPLAGFGFVSFVGFIYCAARVRERRWTVVALGSVVMTLIGYILMASWTAPDGDPSDAAVTYVIGLWISSVVFGFIVNRDYLAWRARRDIQTSGGNA